MSHAEIWTPPRAANRIVKVVEAVSEIHRMDRFPLDVTQVALEAANIFGWLDPISKVQAANIQGFEGALFPNDSRSEWFLLYNATMASPGRIRFTQAHELGHYVLHRALRDSFQCGDSDVLGSPSDEANLEAQADEFASYLLMPMDDFRRQINCDADLNVLGNCAERYGVSLTAAVLKWLEFTEEKAVLIMSKSGFIDWAWSSVPAWKAGAFFRAKGNVIEIPRGTIASDDSIHIEKVGKAVPATSWFQYAENGIALREMKLNMEQFDYILTLLILPKSLEVWSPYQSE
jgi:hypothetical protein